MRRRVPTRLSTAVGLVALMLLAACGINASAEDGDGNSALHWERSTTTTSRAPTTTAAPTKQTLPSTTLPSTPVTPSTTSSTSVPGPPPGTAPEVPTLPLAPTTTTTVLDQSADPPVPVADPTTPPGRNSVMVVGDSVFLGTARTIPLAMSHWVVTYDAVGSRRLAQAVDVLAQRRSEIGGAVVIHLGNNYIAGERGGYASQIEEVMGLLWFVPRVVWVTVSEVNPGRDEINSAIRDAATRWPNMRVAEWAPLIAANPQWSWDGLHLNHDGRWAMAWLVAETLGPVDE